MALDARIVVEGCVIPFCVTWLDIEPHWRNPAPFVKLEECDTADFGSKLRTVVGSPTIDIADGRLLACWGAGITVEVKTLCVG